MARKSSSTISQDELYTPEDQEFARSRVEDARVLDLGADQESPFLRAQKRVSVRRGAIPKKTAARLKWAVLAALGLAAVGAVAAALYSYGEHSWRFRLESSDNIEIQGIHNVNRSQIMGVMGGDIGRNIFFISLGHRKAQLEQIPWVESASVMRFVPNRLRIEIHERTPAAFARLGSRIALVDAGGTLMDLPQGPKKKYSFPVILGMNPGEPLSTRAARMKIYNQLVRELDSGGARYSQDISEVDLTDPEDVKVLVADSGGDVLVHLGSSSFLDRYRIYVSHLREWRQKFDRIESVDLRFDGQIVVNRDLRPAQAPLAPEAARAAVSAGVKPGAVAGASQPGLSSPAQPAVPKPRPTGKAKAAAHKTKPASARSRHRVHPRAASAGAQPGNSVQVTAAAKPSSIPEAPGTVSGGKKPSAAIAKGQDHP